MRYYLLLLSALLFSACAPDSQKLSTAEPMKPVKTFDIHRGVNVSHWLSQSKTRGEDRAAYFTEKEIKAVAQAGFDHIRIPIDEEQMWDEEGKKEAEAFTLLHQALETMAKHKLKAIVDLHIIRSHHFLDKEPALFSDPAEQEKFGNLWVQLSDELSKYPNDQVAYELLNESVAQDHEDWNTVYRVAYDKVRENEPERVIFIGPNRWQNARNFPYLKIPEGDPNIVLSFHFYTPMPISHYGASWTNIKDYKGPVHYPGISINPSDTIDMSEEVRDQVRQYTREVMNKEKLESLMKVAIEKSKELNLQLYCGEFGSYGISIPEDIRFRWFKDIVSILEKHEIDWAAWDLKSNGFGVFKSEDLSLAIPKEILFQE